MNKKNIFDRINDAINGVEQSVVNLVSTVGPWLAPLAPAYSSYIHLERELGYPWWTALAVAAAVEFLGLSTVSTTVAFWMYNKRRDATGYKKAPVWVAGGTFLFYLMVVLTVNVLLDLALIPSSGLNVDYVRVVSKALVILLGLPGVVLLATRTQFSELLKEIQEERLERKQEREREKAQTRAAAAGDLFTVISTDNGDDAAFRRMRNTFMREYQDGTLERRLNGQPMTPEALAGIYGTSTRSAQRWLRAIAENSNGHNTTN